MRKSLTRVLALALLLALLLPLAGLAEATQSPAPQDEQTDAITQPADDEPAEDTADQPADDPAQEEPAATEAPEPTPGEAPEGFEWLKAAAANVPKYYTAIRVPGYEHTVYAFTTKKGETAFRVYGRLNKKKGMFEATVTGTQDALQVAVTGEKPVKDGTASMAKGKPVKLDKGSVPEGYRTTTKRGVIYFSNLFGQKEYRVLGEVEGIANAWYPAVNGRPRTGALAIDLDADQERFRGPNEKRFALPKEYRKGFAIQVFIFTTDGQKVTVLTDKPVIDRETLK